jgi:hypothetical protein
MQVSGGSQSFNAVNTLRLLGRWMQMFTTPNQSRAAKAFEAFDEDGRAKPSSHYDRIVDVMEELVGSPSRCAPTPSISSIAIPSVSPLASSSIRRKTCRALPSASAEEARCRPQPE